MPGSMKMNIPLCLSDEYLCLGPTCLGRAYVTRIRFPATSAPSASSHASFKYSSSI